MEELKIIGATYNVPMFGNKHLNPYGKIEYISTKGKRQVLYYEIGKAKGRLEVLNLGTLYAPKLKLIKH